MNIACGFASCAGREAASDIGNRLTTSATFVTGGIRRKLTQLALPPLLAGEDTGL